MNVPPIPLPPRSTRAFLRRAQTGPGLRRLALVLALAATSPLLAQDVIMSAPTEPLLPATLRASAPPPPPSRAPGPPDTPYKIGPVIFHPHLSYSYINAEGLPAQDGRRVASEIHTVSTALTADLGPRWTLAYSPTWVSYTARAMSDTFDHAFGLSGAMSYQDWAFTFAESYSASTPTLIETGRQTEQETWGTNLGATYSFSPKLQFNGAASVNERYTSVAPRTRSWSGQAGLNLLFSPRLNFNARTVFSYTELSEASDTYGEGFSTGLAWTPMDKLTLSLNGGMDFTHSTSSAGLDLSNPVLDVSVSYQPFETTGISLSAARKVSTSLFQDQVTESLQWGIALQQRLLGRYYLNASYNRQEADYVATTALAAAGRADRVETLSASLTTKLLGRLSVSATFQQSKNTSNTALFSFSSKQYGISLSCDF